MADAVLSYEVHEQIGLITLNRPRALNAINIAMIEQLERVLGEAVNDDLRALVLTGAGNKAFAAGADISQMVGFTPLQAATFAQAGQRALGLLERFPAPTIAAAGSRAR